MHGEEAEATWRNPPCTVQWRAGNWLERLISRDMRLVAFEVPYSIPKQLLVGYGDTQFLACRRSRTRFDVVQYFREIAGGEGDAGIGTTIVHPN